MFGWCAGGDHRRCRRAYVSPGGVRKGELVLCRCETHSCPCAVMSHHFPPEVKASEEGVQAESAGV